MRLVMDLSPHQAAGVLAGLVQTNLMQIVEAGQAGAFPVIHGLRGGQIKYVKADPQEQWQSWEAVLANGTGDCEDLAAAVAAELVAAGVPSRPVAFQAREGLWHVVVEVLGIPAVRWIDPSREGGMEGEA
tara:strand:+ start:2365 stop:2754 length:390 start_codon:yes stop_codon:yes gene_type:complete